jgi:polyphenol oxidase
MHSRGRFVQVLAAASGVALAAPAYAMSCSPRPRGGASFRAGQDVRPIVERKALSAYTQAEIARLRAAYAAMRALPRNDPRSWLMQANLHASYCGQCENSTEQVHGSWSFLPFHRAFLYYHERILGSLTGEIDKFRLPLWEWENARMFPQAYIAPANAGNALWDAKRNAFMLSGSALPESDATADRVALLDDIADFLTFGGGPTTGGALESDPHNVMHVDIGMQEPPWTDMGNLGYSARDPLFYTHHANLDKLWHRWNALGRKNPADAEFLTLRWTFYDEHGSLVSISAADVIDHRQNLRYAYESGSSTTVPPLLAMYDCRLLCCAHGGAVLEASAEVKARVLAAARRGGKVLLVLPRFPIPNEYAGLFDIVAFGHGRRTHLGNLIFTDDVMRMQQRRHEALVLDATEAIEGLLVGKPPAGLYAPARYGGEAYALQPQAAQLRVRA